MELDHHSVKVQVKRFLGRSSSILSCASSQTTPTETFRPISLQNSSKSTTNESPSPCGTKRDFEVKLISFPVIPLKLIVYFSFLGIDYGFKTTVPTEGEVHSQGRFVRWFEKQAILTCVWVSPSVCQTISLRADVKYGGHHRTRRRTMF